MIETPLKFEDVADELLNMFSLEWYKYLQDHKQKPDLINLHYKLSKLTSLFRTSLLALADKFDLCEDDGEDDIKNYKPIQKPKDYTIIKLEAILDQIRLLQNDTCRLNAGLNDHNKRLAELEK